MAKANTINTRLVFDLADQLNCEPWGALGLLEAFWDWCHRNAVNGDIADSSPSLIADGVKWRRKPSRLLEILLKVGAIEWISTSGAHRALYVHDYHDHAPDFVRKRLERSGQNFANGFPPREPKDGYFAAGFVSPTPIENAIAGETAARLRRDNGATKATESTADGETAARHSHAHMTHAEAKPNLTKPSQEEDGSYDVTSQPAVETPPEEIAPLNGKAGNPHDFDPVRLGVEMERMGAPPPEKDPELEARKAAIRRQAGRGGS